MASPDQKLNCLGSFCLIMAFFGGFCLGSLHVVLAVVVLFVLCGVFAFDSGSVVAFVFCLGSLRLVLAVL